MYVEELERCVHVYAQQNKVPPFCLNAALLSTNSLINKYSPDCLWLLEINIPGVVHSALEPVGTFELPKPLPHTSIGDPSKCSQTYATKELLSIMFQMGIREIKYCLCALKR